VSVAGSRGSPVPWGGGRREKKKRRRKLILAVLHFSITRSKTGGEKEKKKRKKRQSRESFGIPEKHLLIVTEGAGQLVPYINCATGRLPFPTRR